MHSRHSHIVEIRTETTRVKILRRSEAKDVSRCPAGIRSPHLSRCTPERVYTKNLTNRGSSSKLDSEMKNTKELRIERGMTQVDLAQRAGISLATIQKFEQGYDRISNRFKRKIARVLDVNPAELFPEAVARHVKTEPSKEEKVFNAQLEVFYNELMTKAHSSEKDLIADDFGSFQNVLYLARKHKVVLPDLK